MKKPLGNIKIVIIEDDQEKSEELIEILYGLGFNLEKIKSSGYAENGIELINDELPDVVLLDLKIPYNEDDRRIKIDNSNKVINEVERLNAARNQEDSSTGIIIISASVQDSGLKNNYKHIPEVVDFFDKDEIALNKDGFKSKLLNKIEIATERDFRHKTQINLSDIRQVNLKKLETIHKGLYERINSDLLGQFDKLNNREINTNQIIENIIGLSGRIVEDILNLVDNDHSTLTTYSNIDNFNSVRNRLTNYTGRWWNNDSKKLENKGKKIFSRSAAEYARLAYMFRSEALHSKEADTDNKNIFVGNSYSIGDAAISINLIMPLILEFIKYKTRN